VWWLAWKCRIHGDVRVSWDSVSASHVEDSLDLVVYHAVGVGGSWFHGEIGEIEELLKNVKLAEVIPLRACINLDEGLVVASFRDPLFADYIDLVACNANELLCIKWVAKPQDLLATLVGDEVARRAALRNPKFRDEYLEVAGFVETVLAPMARFILGEDVDMEKLVGAMRRAGEQYTFIHNELNRLEEALSEEDFRKLRELVKEATHRNFLAWHDEVTAVFSIPRVGENSLMPDGTVGAIVAAYSWSGLDRLGNWRAFVALKNREVYNMAVSVLKEAPHTLFEVAHNIAGIESRLSKITDLTGEDLSRFLEALTKTLIESYRKNDVAFTKTGLSDGRKLYIIVPRYRDFRLKFNSTILILTNHDLKAMYMWDLLRLGRFETVEHVIDDLNDELLAKLDEETKITILKLLFTRALLS